MLTNTLLKKKTYLFVAVLGGHCCEGPSRAAASRVILTGVHSLPNEVAALLTELQSAASAVVVHGPGCSTARGIFPDQESVSCPGRWSLHH